MVKYGDIEISAPIAESEIEKMVNSGANCLMLWDANGMIVDWSIAALDFFGAESKEALYKNIYELSPRYQPDGKLSESAILEWIKHAFKHGTASFDWLCKRLDGRHSDCRVDMYTGEYLGQKIVCAFILERFADNAERIAQERLRYVVDSSPVVCAIFDEDANVQEVSLSVMDVFEISDKSVFIERASDFNPEFQPDGTPSQVKLARTIKQAVDAGHAHMEWMHQTLDGTPIPCKVHIRYTQFGDRNVFIAYTQDLREQKEMIDQLEAARKTEMEQALIRSEMEKEREIHEHVQILLDSAPVTVDIWDDNYNIVSTNRQSPEVLYGASSREEFVREFFSFSPEYQPCGTLTREKAKKYFDLAYQKGQVRVEWMHQTMSGELIPAEITVVRREHGGKTMLLAYTTDLRPLREADAKIREAEELNLLFLNKAPFAINWIDENFQLIDCNTHTLEMFGFTSKEDYRNSIPRLHPEYQPCGTHSTEKILGLLNMAMEKGHARHEWMYKHNNGKLIPAENLFVRLEVKDKTIIVNYTIDLRGVKEAEALTKKVLDNSPLFMEFWDADGNMFDCNTKMLETFGVSSVDELSERFYEFCDPVQPCGTPPIEMHARMTRRALREGICRAECMHVLPNGERMPTEATWVHITHQGKPMIIVYSQDLSPVKKAMEREQEVMERWTAIHESSPIGINFWDKDMNLLGGNKVGYELSGFTCEGDGSKTMLAIAPERQPDGVLSSEKIAKAFETAFTEGYYRFEWMHNTLDGKPLPMDAILKRIEHQGDYMMAVYLQDLRPLREADERLHEAIEMNQLLIDACPMFMEVWDEDVTLIGVNEAVTQVLGLSYKEEFIERYYELSPEFQPCGTRSREKSAAMIEWIKRDGHARFEWIHINLATGEHIPFECTFVMLKQRGKNLIVGYSHDLRPIIATQKKERELELQVQKQALLEKEHKEQERLLTEINNRERLLNVAKQAAEALLTANEENSEEALMQVLEITGRLFDVDRASIWQQEEIDGELHFPLRYEWLSELGKQKKRHASNFAFRYSDDPEYCDKVLSGININGPGSEQTPGVQAYYAEYDILSVVLLPMFLDGKIIGFFSLHDCKTERTFSKDEIEIMCSVGLMITSVYYKMAQSALREESEQERRRTEIAEESNRAKSAFLARMSHEIRTPITAVMGISEIELQDPDLSPRMEETFAKIHSSSNHLLNIVNDVLDLSKIESGRVEILQEEYDVASMVVDVTQLNAAYGNSKEIKFNISIDENLPTHLVGDAVRIGQIMNNLLSNAFKYTEFGTIDFSLHCKKISDEYITMFITITDTGYGMTAEQLAELSTDYTRYHERYVRNVDGTGLGMPIVFNMVQLMGAKIDVESEVGVGTKVVVQIPQKIAGTAILGKGLANSLQEFEYVLKTASKKFAFEPESMPYGSVLVVDDVDANLYVAKGLLAFYDLQIETCTNGFDAIKLIEKGNTYDVIFLDHMMPGMDGTEVLQEMRKLGYMNPIVVLTANAMMGQAEAFIKSGFDGFISKPIQTSQLNIVLTKYIRDKQPPEVIEAAKASGNVKPLTADIHSYQNSDKLVSKLRLDFVKKYSDMCSDIRNAITSEDNEAAKHLLHTLKGVAGLIHELPLMKAAERAEFLLKNGKKPDAQWLSDFESEFKRVIEDIGADTFLPEDDGEQISIQESIALLDKVAPLLESSNSDCVKMLGELRKIPGAAALCDKIEDFDFGEASKILAALKSSLES